MDHEPKLSNQDKDSDSEKSELELTCKLFEDKFGYFSGSNLYSETLPSHQTNPEAVILLNQVKNIHAQFQEAITTGKFGKKKLLLPFLTIASKRKKSSKSKLKIEIIPSTGRGAFKSIDNAFEQMKEMIYLIAFYEGTKRELKPILECIKFLFIYVQEQLDIKEKDISHYDTRRILNLLRKINTAQYDAHDVLELLDTISLRASKALIRRHSRDLSEAEDAGVIWRDSIIDDLTTVKEILRSRLKKSIEQMDEAKAVQSEMRNKIKTGSTVSK